MRLEEWLEANRTTATDFARAIGVDPSSITRLLPGEKKQVRQPGRDLMSKIYEGTDGQVTANDYMVPAQPSTARRPPTCKSAALR